MTEQLDRSAWHTEAATATYWRHRDGLPHILNRLGLTMHVVEVGVWHGDFAAHLHRHLPTACNITLVDPWAWQPDYDDPMNRADFDAVFAGVTARFADAKNVGLMRERSEDAAASFAKHGVKCSAVYIDANHSYEATARDIAAWWPLIEEGGILAGHDYLSGLMDGVAFGVRDAVTEFVDAHKLPVYVTTERYPSWLVRKPYTRGVTT